MAVSCHFQGCRALLRTVKRRYIKYHMGLCFFGLLPFCHVKPVIINGTYGVEYLQHTQAGKWGRSLRYSCIHKTLTGASAREWAEGHAQDGRCSPDTEYRENMLQSYRHKQLNARYRGNLAAQNARKPFSAHP